MHQVAQAAEEFAQTVQPQAPPRVNSVTALGMDNEKAAEQFSEALRPSHADAKRNLDLAQSRLDTNNQTRKSMQYF